MKTETKSVESVDRTDLAHTKVDPYQDPNYSPPVRGEQQSAVQMPIGQTDSLTDQPRQGVSIEEQMAPARYQPRDPRSLKEDTDLDDSMVGEDPMSREQEISAR